MDHGDDFVLVARKNDTMDFVRQTKSKYKVETQVIGFGKNEGKSTTVLNRTIEVDVNNHVVKYKADPRRINKINHQALKPT